MGGYDFRSNFTVGAADDFGPLAIGPTSPEDVDEIEEVELTTLVPVAITEDSSAIVLQATDGSGDEYLLVVDDELKAYLDEIIGEPVGRPGEPAAASVDLDAQPMNVAAVTLDAAAPDASEPEPEAEPEPEREPEPEPEPSAAPAPPPPEVKRAPAAPRARAESVQSQLTPKEIQALLRQGRSVASIAKRAGVSKAWIERFETPIIAERAGMARRAQRATMVRARLGASAAALGEAVLANVRARGIAVDQIDFDASWDSVKRRNGSWLVTFAYTHRRRRLVAQWEYWPEASEVVAINRIATELGWSAPRRRRGR